jgi:hypothetical protein
MKKLLFSLSVLFVPGLAKAQTLGCFVNNATLAVLSTYGWNNVCSVGIKPRCGSSFNENASMFGGPLAELCDNYNAQLAAKDADYDSLADTANNLYANWQACGATTKQINGAIGYWKGLSDYYQGQTTQYQTQTNQLAYLAARLRAACGSKCKKIQ